MSGNLGARPAEVFRQLVKYLLIISFALVIILTAVLALLYYQMAANSMPLTAESMLGIVRNAALLILVILAVPAALATWLLTRAAVRSNQMKKLVTLDEELLDIVTDSIFVHDLNGSCIYGNELAEKFRGHAKDSPVGSCADAQKASEFAALIEPRLKELMEAGEITLESVYAREGQTTVPVEIHSRLFTLGSRKLVLSAVRDITDRKKTEEELRQSSEKIRKAMEGTIQSMSSTTEVRDPYTAGHQLRVAKLAVALATEMGLPEQQVEGMRVAGTLHDIGKIYVPAEILSKPGRLRKNEFNLIKDHSEVGYDLLKDIEFPWPVAQIVLQHHERLDGSGYPQGFSGDAIMIEARIMAVADVVESMSSHRPYRPAFSIEKALLEIIQKKGVLYDPNVVDACIRLFNEKGFTF